jgi:hypothetical protein
VVVGVACGLSVVISVGRDLIQHVELTVASGACDRQTHSSPKNDHPRLGALGDRHIERVQFGLGESVDVLEELLDLGLPGNVQANFLGDRHRRTDHFFADRKPLDAKKQICPTDKQVYVALITNADRTIEAI